MLDLETSVTDHYIDPGLSGGDYFKIDRKAGGLPGEGVILALVLVLVRHCLSNHEIVAPGFYIVDTVQMVAAAGIVPEIETSAAASAP